MESIAEWAAPIATSVAALMTASNLGARFTGYGFVIFTVGSIAWIMMGLATGQPTLVWQNAILTALNLFGIWRWLGRQARLEEGGKKVHEQSEAAPGETLFPVSMLGRAAVRCADDDIGTAVDATATADTGLIRYVVVGSGGVGGVGEEFRRIPWKQVVVEDGAISFRGSPEQFRALPTVEKDRWAAP